MKYQGPRATYKKAGVDIETGIAASKKAYELAMSTHVSRKGMFGAPIRIEDGFTGVLDCGDFLLVHNSDGIGSKIQVAELMNRYETLGWDLLAMVANDAVSAGAEVLSITNTLDTKTIDRMAITRLMEGLAAACREQSIVISGGDISELKDQVKGMVWNASAIGAVEKQKWITGTMIKPRDKIIGLQSRGFHASGISLARYILKKIHGEHWTRYKFNEGNSWGEVILIPSAIYHACVLDMIGRFRKGETHVHVKGIVHVTGGGLPVSLMRVLNKVKRGAKIDTPFPAHQAMLALQKAGNVDDEEVYTTWNMGVGMALIVDESEANEVIAIARKHSIPAQVIGEVTDKPGVELVSQGYFKRGRTLEF